MNTFFRALALAPLIFSAAAVETRAAAPPAPLDVARFTPTGELQKPADLANWVFLGTSLGMGYNPGSFNAANPGQFQVVLMEPAAYQQFVKSGAYAPGSMFMLAFYNSDKQARSINQNGFTQAELTNYEIHVIGKTEDAQRHAFYLFGADSPQGQKLPPKNTCVTCHTDHGAFDGTFAQFYPTLRPLIPKEALEKAARDHNIR
ncbi:MAG: cytochrome P460 family protein [Pseudomonadota bacterium]